MPVTSLYVEGQLDQEVLGFVLGGALRVQKAGGKYALQPIVLREREELPPTDRASVCFLRDRDFDDIPDPNEMDAPKPVTTRGGELVGYRWRRHSLENYFLEPSLAAKALGKDEAELRNLLLQAGRELADYQSARWTIGQARKSLPPARELETRPAFLTDEFDLPEDVSSSACLAWVESAANDFATAIDKELDFNALRQAFENFQRGVSGLDVSGILIWFSGKDLMASIARRLGFGSPKLIRNEVRNWIQRNPDAAVVMLPEWMELQRVLAQ